MVQEMSLKRFSIWSSGGPPVQWSGTICAIHMKLYEIWTRGSGGDIV